MKILVGWSRRLGWATPPALVALIVLYGVYSVGVAAGPGGEHASHGPEEGTIWTCSMHPQIRKDGPGSCPICGMDLIPLKASKGGGHNLTLTEGAKRLAKIRTAVVERRVVKHTAHLIGEVGYDETRRAEISAWFAGRIERVFVDYAGMKVKKGDHLFEIYSPALVAAHEELRQAVRAVKRLDAGPADAKARAQRTLDAVAQKLRRWGLSSYQIKKMKVAKKAWDKVTIYAPQSGVVVTQAIREGAYVKTGQTLYTIAALDWVWLEAEAYEQQLPWVHFGQTARFTIAALPGRTFQGQVSYVAPFLSSKTRSARVRVAVPNPEGLFKPGMFARVVVESAFVGAGRVMDPSLVGKWVSPMHPQFVQDEPGRCEVCGMRMVKAESLGYGLPKAGRPPLVIPATAPLHTGRTAIVYVELPDADEPTYAPREVTLGARAGDVYLVEAGLNEGERVVVQGAFKVDSALQILGEPSMMNLAPTEEVAAAAIDPAAVEARLHRLMKDKQRDTLRRLRAEQRARDRARDRARTGHKP